VQRLLKIATGELPEIIDLSEDAVDKASDEVSAKEDIKHLAPVISTAFRVVLVLGFFFAVLKLWGSTFQWAAYLRAPHSAPSGRCCWAISAGNT
jgi:hypothetical protein